LNDAKAIRFHDASRGGPGPTVPERPGGISLLAILAAATIVLLPVATPSPPDGALGVLVIVAIVVSSVALAYGLWTLRPWAWPLAILFWSIGFLEALWLLTQGTINTNLVVSPLVIAYLSRSDIRVLFRR
jgi:hypothetical protein